MAWEYMDNLDYRYEQARHVLSSIPHGFNLGQCVELCSGNTRFYTHVKDLCKTYRACDTRVPEVIPEGVIFKNITDAQMADRVKRLKTLIVFGHGGYEIDKNPLESPTLTDSILKLVHKCGPRIIILESIQKYSPILRNIHKNIRTPSGAYYEYKEVETKSDNWLHNRVLYVFYDRNRR